MATPAGRRFVWRLLEQAGLLSPSYTEPPTGAAYNEGRRAVAIALLKEVQRVCPDSYATSVEEWTRDFRVQAAEAAKAKGEAE